MLLDLPVRFWTQYSLKNRSRFDSYICANYQQEYYEGLSQSSDRHLVGDTTPNERSQQTCNRKGNGDTPLNMGSGNTT